MRPRTNNRALARLRASDGFTLGEVLATVVLVGLLTLAIATGIGVAVNAYGDIRGYTEEQAVLNNAVTAVTDELRFAYDVKEPAAPLKGTGGDVKSVVFSSTNRDTRLYLGNHEGVIALFGTAAPGNNVDPQQDVQLGDPVPLPLVSTSAGDNSDPGITASLTKLTYANGLWTFSLTVTGGARTLESGELIVRPVNNW